MVVKQLEWEDVGWITLAQDRDQCRAVMKTVIKVQVS